MCFLKSCFLILLFLAPNVASAIICAQIFSQGSYSIQTHQGIQFTQWLNAGQNASPVTLEMPWGPVNWSVRHGHLVLRAHQFLVNKVSLELESGFWASKLPDLIKTTVDRQTMALLQKSHARRIELAEKYASMDLAELQISRPDPFDDLYFQLTGEVNKHKHKPSDFMEKIHDENTRYEAAEKDYSKARTSEGLLDLSLLENTNKSWLINSLLRSKMVREALESEHPNSNYQNSSSESKTAMVWLLSAIPELWQVRNNLGDLGFDPMTLKITNEFGLLETPVHSLSQFEGAQIALVIKSGEYVLGAPEGSTRIQDIGVFEVPTYGRKRASEDVDLVYIEFREAVYDPNVEAPVMDQSLRKWVDSHFKKLNFDNNGRFRMNIRSNEAQESLDLTIIEIATGRPSIAATSQLMLMLASPLK